MFIQTEQTPNPQTLKFLPGKVVMDDGTAFFQNIGEAADSPFAKRLFDVDGVEGVFFGSDFINITKKGEDKSLEIDENDTDIVKQIKELLDTRVRPAVAMDGGDIIYDSFKDGVVYLHMQGACSGCPSSTATLKMGIENMLKHYVPEVQEVRPIDG